MLTLTKTTTPVTGRSNSTQQPRSRRAAVVVASTQSAQSAQSTSRRAAMTTLLGLSAAILSPATPANAFLGIGEDPSAKYTEQTQTLIDSVRAALAVEPKTDEREAAMKGVKEQTVAWVSAYRRDPKFAGRPSFSQMYSAVNALDGQLVSFGLKANFPAKRLDRMMKSIDDAERALKRGR